MNIMYFQAFIERGIEVLFWTESHNIAKHKIGKVFDTLKLVFFFFLNVQTA